MTRILKTLLSRRSKEPSPEELEALTYATMALKVRVEQMTRQTPDRDAA